MNIRQDIMIILDHQILQDDLCDLYSNVFVLLRAID